MIFFCDFGLLNVTMNFFYCKHKTCVILICRQYDQTAIQVAYFSLLINNSWHFKQRFKNCKEVRESGDGLWRYIAIWQNLQ